MGGLRVRMAAVVKGAMGQGPEMGLVWEGKGLEAAGLAMAGAGLPGVKVGLGVKSRSLQPLQVGTAALLRGPEGCPAEAVRIAQ